MNWKKQTMLKQAVLLSSLAILSVTSNLWAKQSQKPATETSSKTNASAKNDPATKTSDAADPAKAPTTARLGSFQKQIGVGGTVIFAQPLWDVRSISFFYQGGLVANVWGRVHPYVTLEGSIGGVGSLFGIANYSSYGEFTMEVGPRIYVINMTHANLDRFFVAPYVIGALQFSVAGNNPFLNNYTLTAYFGFEAGGGAEFRINSHLVAHADLRFLVRGSATFPSLAQVGFRLGAGFGYYF